MWRIKYYLPFIVLVSISSFFILKYVDPAKEVIDKKYGLWQTLKNNSWGNIPDTFAEFNKKFDDKNYFNEVYSMARSDKLGNYDSSPEEFYNYYNSIGIYAEQKKPWHQLHTVLIIVFALFPLLLFELLRLIYFSFSRGKFSESYISLSAKKISLKYRLAKIEKKKSIEELKKKLSETNTNE